MKERGIKNANPISKRLYTIEEAGVYLGSTAWGIRELIWSGKVPYVRAGKKIYLDILYLDEFIEKHKTRYEFRGMRASITSCTLIFQGFPFNATFQAQISNVGNLRVRIFFYILPLTTLAFSSIF
jgi:hypothetical protein